MEERHNTGSLLERLRRNVEENVSLFRAAGIVDERVKVVHCRECGTSEPAYFWTVGRRSGDTLHLSCPSCQTGGVRYDLRENDLAVRGKLRRPGWKWTLLAPALGALVWLLGPEPLQQWAADRWDAVERRVLGGAPGEPDAGPPPVLAALRDEASAVPLPGVSGELTERVFLADGDRRAEVKRLRDELARRSGPEAAAAMHDLRYLEEFDKTRVIVAARSREWARLLSAERGWQRTGPQK